MKKVSVFLMFLFMTCLTNVSYAQNPNYEYQPECNDPAPTPVHSWVCECVSPALYPGASDTRQVLRQHFYDPWGNGATLIEDWWMEFWGEDENTDGLFELDEIETFTIDIGGIAWRDTYTETARLEYAWYHYSCHWKPLMME